MTRDTHYLSDTTQSMHGTGVDHSMSNSHLHYIRTYIGNVCKYLKHIKSINLCKCNNVVHLCRLGSGVQVHGSLLQPLSTVSLSGLLPLYTHLFLS